MFYFVSNYRPKICIEKCDADKSKQRAKENEQSAAQIAPTKDLSTCENSTHAVDLTETDDVPIHSSEIKVPAEYEHILKRPVYVQLIKYKNIEEMLKSPTSEAQQENDIR